MPSRGLRLPWSVVMCACPFQKKDKREIIRWEHGERERETALVRVSEMPMPYACLMSARSWLFAPWAICFLDEIIKCHSLRSVLVGGSCRGCCFPFVFSRRNCWPLSHIPFGPLLLQLICADACGRARRESRRRASTLISVIATVWSLPWSRLFSDKVH